MTLAAALLAACAAEPPAPVRDAIDVDIPAAWSAGGAQADGALRIDWWREFGDPRLDELVTLGLANNPDV
ncbi:MAG: hypothetical protein VX044_10310, partial [Planctomycetota bacterium]|nr:hypothetical protein [Planctomycetota bacterium]